MRAWCQLLALHSWQPRALPICHSNLASSTDDANWHRRHMPVGSVESICMSQNLAHFPVLGWPLAHHGACQPISTVGSKQTVTQAPIAPFGGSIEPSTIYSRYEYLPYPVAAKASFASYGRSDSSHVRPQRWPSLHAWRSCGALELVTYPPKTGGLILYVDMPHGGIKGQGSATCLQRWVISRRTGSMSGQ